MSHLTAQGVTLSFSDNQVLNDVDFALAEGELVGLIGPNGAGKTSFLRVLANLQDADKGVVKYNHQDITKLSEKELAKACAYLPQGAPAHWPLTTRRVVELGRLPHLGIWEIYSDQDHQAIENAMALAEVTHLADRTITTLSGGERLRVMIARMFATQPSIMLADEPIAALDPYHQLHTMELLQHHCDKGGSAVVVMHDLSMAARFCHRLVLMHNGTIAAEGKPDSVLSNETIAEVYGIDSELYQNDDVLTVLVKSRISHDH